MDNLLINENKNCEREYNGEKYARYAIRTPLITKNDNIVDVARTYAAEHLEQGDILFFSEDGRRQNVLYPVLDLCGAVGCLYGSL